MFTLWRRVRYRVVIWTVELSHIIVKIAVPRLLMRACLVAHSYRCFKLFLALLARLLRVGVCGCLPQVTLRCLIRILSLHLVRAARFVHRLTQCRTRTTLFHNSLGVRFASFKTNCTYSIVSLTVTSNCCCSAATMGECTTSASLTGKSHPRICSTPPMMILYHCMC